MKDKVVGDRPHRGAVNKYSRVNDGRTVQGTLYQLKSGRNAGKLLGSNVVNYADVGGTDQVYVPSEAPFDANDYYRMVADMGAGTLVSLTNDKDRSRYKKTRDVDAHHLEPGKSLHFDAKGLLIKKGGTTVMYVGETQCRPPYPDSNGFTVKTYTVTREGEKPRKVHHIIYRKWRDHGEPSKPKDSLALIDAINESQEIVGKSPIVVNCVYGQGRTNALIVMHQMERVMDKSLEDIFSQNVPPQAKLIGMEWLREQLEKNAYKTNVNNFIHACEGRVIRMDGGQMHMLQAFPKLLMDTKIEKFAAENGLDPADPTKAASAVSHASKHPPKKDDGKGGGPVQR